LKLNSYKSAIILDSTQTRHEFLRQLIDFASTKYQKLNPHTFDQKLIEEVLNETYNELLFTQNVDAVFVRLEDPNLGALCETFDEFLKILTITDSPDILTTLFLQEVKEDANIN
jgi:hypothetical protein